MTSIEIYDSGKHVLIPSTWDEMSAEQIRHIFMEYDKAFRCGMSPLVFNVRVLYYLMGIKRTFRAALMDRLYPQRAMKKAENVYRICDECLAFLFSEPDSGGQVRLSFDSVKNPLPYVKCGLFRTLCGPADLLQDLTFGEFRHAAVSLNNFFLSKEIADLDECIAHLYRVKSWNENRAGRYVRNVTNNSVKRDIMRASRIPVWQKTLIMMWFSSCLRYLQNGTVIIDGEKIDMGLLFAKDEDSRSGVMGYSWNDLLIEIAKEHSVGNIERVDDEPLFSIFSIMWHNYKERKRNEKISKTR